MKNLLKMIRKKYNEVDDQYRKMDLHIHSSWTDGKDSIACIVKQAEFLQLHTIAITDHIRSDSEYFPQYTEQIREIDQTTNVKVLAGFESKIRNFKGELDVSEGLSSIADIRIASVHRFPIADKLFSPSIFAKESAQAIELELSLAVIENGELDVIGHAGGMCLRYFNDFPQNYFEMIIIACVKYDIVFEINSEYHAKVYAELAPLLTKHNPFVFFGSDAHEKRKIAEWISLARK